MISVQKRGDMWWKYPGQGLQGRASFVQIPKKAVGHFLSVSDNVFDNSIMIERLMISEDFVKLFDKLLLIR